jgi:hypothetical protein
LLITFLPRTHKHQLGDFFNSYTYYRWRKEYGGLKLEQAKRMKTLEKENTRLRHVVAELSLEKQIRKDVAEGNF